MSSELFQDFSNYMQSGIPEKEKHNMAINMAQIIVQNLNNPQEPQIFSVTDPNLVLLFDVLLKFAENDLASKIIVAFTHKLSATQDWNIFQKLYTATLSNIPATNHKYVKLQSDVLNILIQFSNEVMHEKIDNFKWTLTQLQTVIGQAAKNEDFDTEAKILLLTLMKHVDLNPEHAISIINIPEITFMVIDLVILSLQQFHKISDDLEANIFNFIVELVWNPLDHIKEKLNDNISLVIINKKWNLFIPALKTKLCLELVTRIITILSNPSDPRFTDKDYYINFILTIYLDWATDTVLTKNIEIIQLWYKLGQLLITPEFFITKTKDQRLKALSLAKSLALSQRDTRQTMELLGITIKALLANKENQIDAQLIHTEIVATFNDSETLINYLEELFQVVEINEDTILSLIYIMNVSLEALQKLGKTKSFKGFREKEKFLLNTIFKSDILTAKDPLSEDQIVTFFKNLSLLEEDKTYIGEDLAPLLHELIISGKTEDFKYWLYKIIKIFKGNAVSIILLYQLTHLITSKLSNNNKNGDINEPKNSVLIIREVFLNLFTIQKEPWYYTNKGPILPAEIMTPILTEILQLFPTTLYNDEINHDTVAIVRMHLGHGYQYLQSIPQYLHFLANEYTARLISGDAQFLQPIKQELLSLSFDDLQSFFKTHGVTLWEYLHNPDPSKVSLFILSELLEIYVPYALHGPKEIKEEREHITTIEKLFLRCMATKKDLELVTLDNIATQILKIYNSYGLYHELPEVLARYIYTVAKMLPIENIDTHIQNTFQTLGLLLTKPQLVLAKIIWLQKTLISDDSLLSVNFDLCIDSLIHNLEMLNPSIHQLSGQQDLQEAVTSYHHIFDSLNKKTLPNIWKGREQVLLNKIFPILILQIKTFDKTNPSIHELVKEYYQTYLELLFTSTSLTKENIRLWIEYLYQEDFEFDTKHALTLDALNKLFLISNTHSDFSIPFGIGLDLLDYLVQHQLYLNRKDKVGELYNPFFQAFSLETIFSLKPLYKDIFKKLYQILATDTIKIQDEVIIKITGFFGTIFEYTHEVELLEYVWPKLYDYLKQKPYLKQPVFDALEKYLLKVDPGTETFIIKPSKMGTIDITARIRLIANICNTWIEYNIRDFLEKKLFLPYYSLLKVYQKHEDSPTNQCIHLFTRNFILTCYREQVVLQKYYPDFEKQIQVLINDLVINTLTTWRPNALNEFRNEIFTLYPKIDALILEKQFQALIGYQNSSNRLIQDILQVIEPIIKQYNTVLSDTNQKEQSNTQLDNIVSILSKMLWNIYLEIIQRNEEHSLEHPILINESTKQRVEQLIWENDLFWSELPNIDLKAHAVKSWSPSNQKIAKTILSVLEQRGFTQDVIETITTIINQNPTYAESYYLFLSLLKKSPIENQSLIQPALNDFIKKFLAFYKYNQKQNDWETLGKELITILLENYPNSDLLLISQREEFSEELTQLLHIYVKEKIETTSWQNKTIDILLKIFEKFGYFFDQEMHSQVAKLAVMHLIQSLSTSVHMLRPQKDLEILEMNKEIYHIWRLSYFFISNSNKEQALLIQHAKELIAVFNTIDSWANDKYPGNLILPLILGFLNPYYTLEPLKVWKKLETHIRNNIRVLTKAQQEELLYKEQHEMFEDLVMKLKTFTLDKKIFPAVDTQSLSTFHENLESMLAQYTSKAG